MFKEELSKLFQVSRTSEKRIVTEDMLSGLPAPVQRYLRYTGVVGTTMVDTVRLKQTLRMRDKPEDAWMNMTAEQYYSVAPAGFLWLGTVRTAGIPIVQVRDKYSEGKGNMLIKALSVVPMAESKGNEMDRGAMYLYFNEIMWFPTALLGENVRFEPIDDNSVKGIFTDQGRSIDAVWQFDKEGRLFNFIAQRHRALNHGKDGYQLTTWKTPISAYLEFNGLKLPSKGSAVYELESGDFAYGELEITDLEYTIREKY